MFADRCTKKTLVGLHKTIAFKNALTSEDIKTFYDNSYAKEVYDNHYDIDPSSVVSMLYPVSSFAWYNYSVKTETIQMVDPSMSSSPSEFDRLNVAAKRVLTAQVAKYDTVGRNWGLDNTGLLLSLNDIIPQTQTQPPTVPLRNDLPKIEYPKKIRNLITYGQLEGEFFTVVCRLESADSNGNPILANPKTLFGFGQTVHDILRQPAGTVVQLNYEITVFSSAKDANTLAKNSKFWKDLLVRMNFHLELLYKDLRNVKVGANIKLASIWYRYSAWRIASKTATAFVSTEEGLPKPIRIALRGFDPPQTLFNASSVILLLLDAVDQFCMAENPTITTLELYKDPKKSYRGGLDKLLTLLTSVDFTLDAPSQDRLRYVSRIVPLTQTTAGLAESKKLPSERSERLALSYDRQNLWRCLHPLNHGILFLDEDGYLSAKSMELYGSSIGDLVTDRFISSRNRYSTLVFAYLNLRWPGWAKAYAEKMKDRGWIRIEQGEFGAEELSFLVFFHWFSALIFDSTLLQWTDPLDWLPLTLEQSEKLEYNGSMFLYLKGKITMDSVFNQDWFDPPLQFTAFDIDWKNTIPETHTAMMQRFFKKV